MIIKRKCFSLFGNFGIDKKPITLNEVKELSKKYPGFVCKSIEDVTKFYILGKELNKYSSMKIFKNNKYKLLGVRPISDIDSNSSIKSYYLYFNPSTQINYDELNSAGLLTYDDLIKEQKEGLISKTSNPKIPNVSLFGKKIMFDNGIGSFNSFNINELKRRVKLDDFYKAIYDWEREFGDNLSLNSIKKRIELSEVYWDGLMDDALYVIFEDFTTGLFYSFRFKSSNDKVEVEEVGD